MDTQNLLEMSYEDRKYIYIVKNQEEKNIRQLLKNSSERKKKTVKKLAAAGILIGGPIVAAGLATGLVTSKVIKGKKKEPISVYDATRNQLYGVLFPGDGIPLNNTTYICNPVDNRRYYEIDNFHREMVNHKVYEAIYLLRSLGAIEINVLINEEVSGKFDLNLSVEMFSSCNNFSNIHNSKSEFNASYEPSDKPPFIPEDVYWIDKEPQWQHIANERMYNGLTSFKLDVEVSDNFGVNSELAAIIKDKNGNINSKISGKYNKFKKSSMVLSGAFFN